MRPADVLAYTVPPILGEVIERKQPGQNWRPTAAGAGDTLMYGLGWRAGEAWSASSSVTDEESENEPVAGSLCTRVSLLPAAGFSFAG